MKRYDVNGLIIREVEKPVPSWLILHLISRVESFLQKNLLRLRLGHNSPQIQKTKSIEILEVKILCINDLYVIGAQVEARVLLLHLPGALMIQEDGLRCKQNVVVLRVLGNHDSMQRVEGVIMQLVKFDGREELELLIVSVPVDLCFFLLSICYSKEGLIIIVMFLR